MRERSRERARERVRESSQARDGLLERVCERGRRERKGVIVMKTAAATSYNKRI